MPGPKNQVWGIANPRIEIEHHVLERQVTLRFSDHEGNVLYVVGQPDLLARQLHGVAGPDARERYGRPTDPHVADERPISPRSVLVAHPREGEVRFDAYPGRDLIGDVARFAAGGLGITVGRDHATLAIGGVILDADEPLPDMPRFDLVLIGGVV